MDDSAPNGTVFQQRIRVSFEYGVYFTRGVFARTNPVFLQAIRTQEPHRRHRLFVVVDEGVAAAWPGLGDAVADYCSAHPQHLELVGPPRVVPGGEQAKQAPELITSLLADLHRLHIDRQAFVVAIGGGAVLDAVGYAAAIAHRGVRLIRLPTTVLSQNDSGVGVKNGVNAFGAKNFIGTFVPPFAVINDLDFIETLEPRDQRAGIAEAVKVALIRDRAFFQQLERRALALSRFEADAMASMIQRAAEIHMRHIEGGGDPFETGSARPLDFGHWAAHKLESLSAHDLRHGEAVAIGMALDCRYSFERGMLDEASFMRALSLLERLGFRLWHDALDRRDETGELAVLAGLEEFREHLGGELTVTLLSNIGEGVEVNAIDTQDVLRSLAWLRRRDEQRRAGMNEPGRQSRHSFGTARSQPLHARMQAQDEGLRAPVQMQDGDG